MTLIGVFPLRQFCSKREALLELIRFLTHRQGAIAQLGERIVRNDEVVGSIPTSSTKLSISYRCRLPNHLPNP
jgi:hypothetical protein